MKPPPSTAGYSTRLSISSSTVRALIHSPVLFLSCRSAGFAGALSKVKDELMLLGFISLMLLIVEDDLTGICLRNTSPWNGGVKCASAPAPGLAPAPASAPAAVPGFNWVQVPASVPASVPAPAPYTWIRVPAGYTSAPYTKVPAPLPAADPAPPGRRLLSAVNMLPFNMPNRRLLGSYEVPKCEQKGLDEGKGEYYYTAFLDERALLFSRHAWRTWFSDMDLNA